MQKLVAILLMFIIPVCVTQAQSSKTVTGMLEGKAAITPLCPHEPCQLSPEQLKQFYAGYKAVIYDGKKVVLQKLSLSANGAFSIKLKPGNYYAAIVPASQEPADKRESFFRIWADKNTQLTLEYDAGTK